jgi:hypothetical protein
MLDGGGRRILAGRVAVDRVPASGLSPVSLSQSRLIRMLSSVTAPMWASRRPDTVASVVRVMLAEARMLPTCWPWSRPRIR